MSQILRIRPLIDAALAYGATRIVVPDEQFWLLVNELARCPTSSFRGADGGILVPSSDGRSMLVLREP